MKSIPLIRSVSLTPFVEFLRRGDSPVESQLVEAGIYPEILNTPESFLSHHCGSLFVRTAAHREGVEDLGLQVGAATPIISFGLFGHAVSQALTLNDVIRKLVRLIPMVVSGGRTWIEEVDENTLELRLRIPGDEDHAQIDAFCLMLLMDAIRMAAGPEWRPRFVALDPVAGRMAHRHDVLGEAIVDGEVDYLGVQFPREFLRLPVRRGLKAERSAGEAERELIATAPAVDFAGSISQAISGTLWLGAPTIELAAEMAGTSVRTLQRRLAKSALSYEDVLDRVRFDAAMPMMDDPGTKLSEIAFQVGYSDAANFTRAFRRWTGTTPSAFRSRPPQALTSG